MGNDWYRNHRWNAQIESEFLARLARSRSQRDQYLVIQALTLAGAVPEATLQLVDRYFQSKSSDFEDVRALTARAHAFLSLNQLPRALESLKEVLAIERVRPRHRTTAYLQYPYLVATNQIVAEYDAAKRTLEERAGDVMFPVDRFQWHASHALIEDHCHNADLAHKHAALALEAAVENRSGFRHHPGIGLVNDEHAETVKRLRDIERKPGLRREDA